MFFACKFIYLVFYVLLAPVLYLKTHSDAEIQFVDKVEKNKKTKNKILIGQC